MTVGGIQFFHFSALLVGVLFFEIPVSYSLRFCDEEEVRQMDVDGAILELSRDYTPFLQNVTSSSALLEWYFLTAKESRIQVTDDNEDLAMVIEDKRRHHVVGICDLVPGHSYRYRVDHFNWITFRSLPDSKQDLLNFAVVGDSGDAGPNQRSIVQRMKETNPNLILHLGDLAYPHSTMKELERHFLIPFRSLLSSVPIFPVMGNHEYDTDSGKPYLNLFSLPHNNPIHSERYYSFDAGPVHFTVIDSEGLKRNGLDDQQAQIDWLESDLIETKQPWKIVSFHHPLYAGGILRRGDRKLRELLHPIFSKHGVQVVFNGHAHNYSRSKAIDGVRYIVSGGGGGQPRPIVFPPSELEVTHGNVFHFVSVHIQGNVLRLYAFTDEGEVLDQLTLQIEGQEYN